MPEANLPNHAKSTGSRQDYERPIVSFSFSATQEYTIIHGQKGCYKGIGATFDKEERKEK
jgi:hypothetical protein